jgi:hypothetical protein
MLVFLRSCADALPKTGSKITARGLVREEQAHGKATARIAFREAVQVACTYIQWGPQKTNGYWVI